MLKSAKFWLQKMLFYIDPVCKILWSGGGRGRPLGEKNIIKGKTVKLKRMERSINAHNIFLYTHDYIFI